MKKLEKLTLKELKVLMPELDQNDSGNIKGGGHWVMSAETGWQWSYMLDTVTVTGSASGSSAGSYPLGSFPPIDQGSIGPTPEQQYSKACAEGYTQAAMGLLFCGIVVVYSGLEAWCIATGKGPVGGQAVIYPQQ